MAIREKLTQNARRLLDPDEQVQAVIPAQTMSGWLGALGAIVLVLANRYRPVIVTEKRIVITDSGRWTMGNPKSIVSTLPRSTQIGPAHGMWWKCLSLGQEPLYIHKRFHKDVEQADALRA